MNTLVSIIVPIFNVEKYLEHCLSSLCNQTYGNLDIVLVDDGSTDQSGNLIDLWSKKDKRIQALHKSNGGLSDARNYGLDFAKGEFVIFVDSDDYMSIDSIEYMLQIQKNLNSDIVIGAFIEVDENTNSELRVTQNAITINFTPEKAIEESLYRKYFGCSACGNLYRKKVISRQFPKGRLYEDLSVTYIFMSNASRITYTSKIVYYYRQRAGSIIHSFNISRIDYLKGAQELENFCKIHYPKLEGVCKCRVFSSAINFVINIDNNSKQNHLDLFLLAWREVKRTRIRVLVTRRSRLIEKSAALFSYFGPSVIRLIWNLMR